MTRPIRTALAALAFALATGGAHALGTGDSLPALQGERLGPGGEAPALRGKVVYVDFWASWCVPCRKSMPALDALYKKHAAAGFVVVGMNKDTKEADALRFLERVPVAFPLVWDEGDRVARAFGVRAMPSGYLVDRKGVIRRVHQGFTDETAASLAAEIEALLKETP